MGKSVDFGDFGKLIEQRLTDSDKRIPVILGTEGFAIKLHIEVFKQFYGREPTEEEKQNIINGIKEAPYEEE